MIFKFKKNLFENILLFSTTVLLVIYRFFWVDFAYWGEDSATNLWLGYLKPFSELNVGLISSQFIPNPNGMMILGKFLSLFGSSFYISLFLTLLNLFILYFFLSNFFNKKNFDFYLLFLLGGSSILISSTAMEFWNQWILLTINLLIMGFIFQYINTNKVKSLYVLISLIPLPVFVYLGGLTNTLVFGIIFLYLIFKTYNKNSLNFLSLGIFTIFVATAYWVLSFEKFFNAISLTRLTSLNSLSIFDRIKYLLNNLLKLPDGLLNTWNNEEKFVIFQTDQTIINDFTKQLLEIFYQFHKIIPLLAFVLFSFTFLKASRITEVEKYRINHKKTNILVFFISFSLVMSPIYGGPDFLIIQEKSNNLNQYYLFFILLWYLLPSLIDNYKKSKIIVSLNRGVFVCFIVLNLILGFQIIKDNELFDQNIETSIEASLRDKIKVVNFIAKEWESQNSSKVLSIEYNTFVSDMEWFDQHTFEFSRYYKPSPYTEGRLLDYELLRRYDLINSFSQNTEPNFIVTNIFDPKPTLNNKILDHYKFGRLRVTKITE
jgi:hypothetical protein